MSFVNWDYHNLIYTIALLQGMVGAYILGKYEDEDVPKWKRVLFVLIMTAFGVLVWAVVGLFIAGRALLHFIVRSNFSVWVRFRLLGLPLTKDYKRVENRETINKLARNMKKDKRQWWKLRWRINRWIVLDFANWINKRHPFVHQPEEQDDFAKQVVDNLCKASPAPFKFIELDNNPERPLLTIQWQAFEITVDMDRKLYSEIEDLFWIYGKDLQDYEFVGSFLSCPRFPVFPEYGAIEQKKEPNHDGAVLVRFEVNNLPYKSMLNDIVKKW